MTTYTEVALESGMYRHHPSADIDQGAIIGQDTIIDMARIGSAIIGSRTEVGDFTTIMDGALIGDDCNIRRNVVVNNGVVIGSAVKIQNQVSIPPGVMIESCAFVGPGAKFPNDRHPRSFVAWQPGPETNVRLGASIGANATVVCGERRPTTISEFSLLAAGSTATRSTKPFGLYVGDQQRGWVNVLAETISRDPCTIPPTEALLHGIDLIPVRLRPDDVRINEILHHARKATS